MLLLLTSSLTSFFDCLFSIRVHPSSVTQSSVPKAFNVWPLEFLSMHQYSFHHALLAFHLVFQFRWFAKYFHWVNHSFFSCCLRCCYFYFFFNGMKYLITIKGTKNSSQPFPISRLLCLNNYFSRFFYLSNYFFCFIMILSSPIS